MKTRYLAYFLLLLLPTACKDGLEPSDNAIPDHCLELTISLNLAQKVGQISIGISFLERMNMLVSKIYAISDVVIHEVLISIAIETCQAIGIGVAQLTVVDGIMNMDSKQLTHSLNASEIETSTTTFILCADRTLTVFQPERLVSLIT